MRYRATLAYDGAPFLGYQRQRDGVPTVQGAVEAALRKINRNEPVTVYGAGRTDTGVHATGQVIAFDLNWQHSVEALAKALNGNLPDAVAVSDIREADTTFHPRFDALHRTYCYTLVCAPYRKPLLRHTAWVVLRRLDIEAMQRAVPLLIGKRDFGALGTPPVGDNTVREIMAATLTETHEGDEIWLRFTVRANAFLYRMIRRTVGALYDIGRGQLTVEGFAAGLDTAKLMGSVTIAPPQGLVLTQVAYPND